MIKIQWLASIWRQNDTKCWVTSQNIQNKAKLQKWTMTCNLTTKVDQNIQNKGKLQKWSKWLASIWRQNDQNVELRRKTFKTKLNYKSDQNPMTCIDLTSKRSKCWVTSQNIQNKAKLQKWSKSNDLHRFDDKTIKNVELRRKTFATTKLKIDLQNCIDWMSKRSIMLSYVAKHSTQF